jgi:hypothetical protein
MPEDILFKGKFDATEINNGIDKAIEGYKNMAGSADKLNTSLATTTSEIEANKKTISTLFREQQKLDKGSKDYATTIGNLNKQIDALKTKNEALTNTFTKQKTEATAATASVEKIKGAYAGAEKAMEGLNKAGQNLGGAVSGEKLLGKLADVKEKVAAAAQGIGDNLKNNIGNVLNGDLGGAVASVEEGVTSLGASFGIFGAVAAASLIPIVKGLYDMYNAETTAEQSTRLLNESLSASASATAAAGNEVDVLKLKFDLARQGILNKKDVLEDYNNTLGKTLGVTTSFNEAEESLIRNAETYIKIIGLKAQAQAIANLKIQASEKKVKADLNLEDNRNIATKVFDLVGSVNKLPGLTGYETYLKNVERSKKRFNTNIVADSEETIKLLTGQQILVETTLATLESQFKDKPKTLEKKTAVIKQAKVIERKVIADIYKTELEKLEADIALIDKKAFTNEDTIIKAIKEKFDKRRLFLEDAQKNGELTKPELKDLKGRLTELENKTELKELIDFSEKKEAYLNKINEDIIALNNEASIKRIGNIQNDYERERQLLDANQKKNIDGIEKQRKEKLLALEKNANNNGIGTADLANEKQLVNNAIDELIAQVQIAGDIAIQELSFKAFQKIFADSKEVLDTKNLGVSITASIKIEDATKQYLAGEISYKDYQKKLTKIQKDEIKERNVNTKAELQKEIDAITKKLTIDSFDLTDEQTKKLEKQREGLRKQIADLNNADNVGAANEKDKKKQDRISQFVQYANAIGGITQQIVSFWAKANEAELAGLDKSISIQQKRVDAAQKIAERGNAEYLRLEEDRLRDLEVKRENAARKQMAINAALQISQTLTALISGIAQGASAGGPLGALIGLTAIIGAIASGYAIVKSLQPQQPSFFVGTTDTGTGGNVDSKGGFNATLHPHERVLTAEQNKQLKGISNEKLIETVNNHRIIVNSWKKPMPQLNMAAIDMANEVTNTQQIRMAGVMNSNNEKLEENNILQRKILKALTNMGVNVNVDRNGLAISVLEAVEEIEISKNS